MKAIAAKHRTPKAAGEREMPPIMTDWSMAYKLPELTPTPLVNAIDDIHLAAMLPALMPVEVKPIASRDAQEIPNGAIMMPNLVKAFDNRTRLFTVMAFIAHLLVFCSKSLTLTT